MTQLMTKVFEEQPLALPGSANKDIQGELHPQHKKEQLGVLVISAHDPLKSQPCPRSAVFNFPCRGRGWLEQISFVQSCSTRSAGMASMLKAMMI